MLIRNVRPWGGPPCDIEISGERITAIHPAEHAPASPKPDDAVEGAGRLLLPAFSDVHVHLDSTRIGQPFRPHTGGNGVWEMMLNDRRNWRDTQTPHAEIVAETLKRMIAAGTTRVRSFAQVDVDCRLERFDSVMAAKERFAAHAEVQVITFPQAGILREEGTVELLEESLRQGSDVIGGIDPCQLDRDPARHLDLVFELAEKYQVEVDIHLHEPSHLAVFSTELIMERTRALGMNGKVTISHGYELGGAGEARSHRLIEELADLDIAMTTIAPPVRNSLPLTSLVEAGVRVGLGQDGQRDYWSPYGNCDMLHRTWQLAFTHNYRRDDHIEMCLAIASLGGAAIMDLGAPRLSGISDRPGISLGDRADFLIIDGETPTSAVMDQGLERTVIHRGRVVADHGRIIPATQSGAGSPTA